jgi:streptogramin lyase
MRARGTLLAVVASLLAGAPSALGAAGEVSHYPTDRLTTPNNVLATPDGAIWAIDSANHNGPAPLLVKFDTAGHVLASIQLPHPTLGLALANGPDGNVWVLQSDNGDSGVPVPHTGYIDKVPPSATTTADVTEYTYNGRTNGSESFGAGADGRLWFGLNRDMGAITTSGVVSDYSTPAAGTIGALAAGPDGNVWFTDGADVFRISTAGAIVGLPYPTGGGSFGMAWGPDGNLWLTQTGPAAVGRLTPAGMYTTFPVEAGSLPFGIAPGPDGQMWFAERNSDKIGAISVDGATLHEYPTGNSNDGALFITAGADHRMWFNEFNNSAVGAITTDAPVIVPPGGGGGGGTPGGGGGSGTPGGGGSGTTGTSAGAGGAPVGRSGAPALPDLPRVPIAAGCTPGKFALTDVFPAGGRTRLLGVAPPAAVGKSITLVAGWNHRTVATVKVAADGSFSASAPLPPGSLRTSNRARYAARLGAATSTALKFARRMYTMSITAAGRTITFTGAATAPLAKPPASVTIRAATSCSSVASGTPVATARAGRTGRFSATFTLPGALATAPVIYLRAETAVRKTTKNPKTFMTYTLVRGVRIGS